MAQLFISDIAQQPLRLVIIEAMADGRFGLTVSIGTETYQVVDANCQLYTRGDIDDVTHDLAYCKIDNLFLHIGAISTDGDTMHPGYSTDYVPLAQNITLRPREVH